MALDINSIMGGVVAPEQKQEKTFSEEVIANQAVTQQTENSGKVDIGALFAEASKDTSALTLQDEYVGIPQGQYLATIKEIKVKESKTGTPFAAVKYEILDDTVIGEKEVKAGRTETEFIFLTRKNKETNKDELDIKKLGQRLQVINKGSTEEQAIQATLAIIKAFINGGNEDLVLNEKNGIVENAATLKVTKRKWTPKEGKNAGIEQENTYYSFKAA